MNLINIVQDGHLSQQDKITLIKKHAKGGGINIVNDRGFTPLMSAIYNHYFDVAEALLKLGANAWLIDSTTGRNYVNIWANIFNEYEYWEDLERGIYLFAEHAAWEKPEWCEIFIKLIFDKGWPQAADNLSGNLDNMKKHK